MENAPPRPPPLAAAGIILALLAWCGPVRAGEERPDFFRLYHFFDLAECLERFKEREFFEAMHGRAFSDRTPESMFMLGLLHHHGLGTPPDAARAVRWYAEAARAGYGFPGLGNEAAAGLALLTLRGPPSPRPPDDRLRELMAAARAGGAGGQLAMAHRFWRGLCAPLDWEAAREWELLAAENGSREAMRIVAENYFSGNSAYPRDLGQALRWYDALTDAGDPLAAIALGDAYRDGVLLPRDDAKAVELYERAAASDSFLAWSRLHDMYNLGLGVRSDPERLAFLREKIDIAKQLAETARERPPRPLAEYAGELYREGRRRYDGDGVPRDRFQAAMLFADAAGLGTEEPENHYLLGWIQEQGLAGAPNPYGAGKSYRVAALLGHGRAMFRLARLHEEGRGVRRSLAQAERWYGAARAAGVPGAGAPLARVGERLAAGHREDWEESPAFRKVLDDARRRASVMRIYVIDRD